MNRQVHIGWLMLSPAAAVIGALLIVSLPRMGADAPKRVSTLDCGLHACWQKPQHQKAVTVCINCFSTDMVEPFRGYRVLP